MLYKAELLKILAEDIIDQVFVVGSLLCRATCKVTT